MYKIKSTFLGLLMFICLVACQEQVEHTAPAILARDSVAMMTSYGVIRSSVIRV